MLRKLGLDIQSQTKVSVRKLKNPKWPPGGHFESNIAEKQWASVHIHIQGAHEIHNWNSEGNSSYGPETMLPVESGHR